MGIKDTCVLIAVGVALLLAGCEALPEKNQLESVSLQPESFVGQTVEITGRYDYWGDLERNWDGPRGYLEDSSGFRVLVKNNQPNQLYSPRLYTAKGELVSEDVCTCVESAKQYKNGEFDKDLYGDNKGTIPVAECTGTREKEFLNMKGSPWEEVITTKYSTQCIDGSEKTVYYVNASEVRIG